VVLTGTLDDGAIGAAAIERCGGLVAVQDPAESPYAGMPRAARAATAHPRILPVEAIASLIVEQSHEPVPVSAVRDPGDPDDPAGQDPLHGSLGRALHVASTPPGEWSGLTCPECGGPLHYSPDTEPGRYECRVGHGWSPASLLDGHSSALEQALWVAALRLDERVRLTQRMAEEAEKRGHPLSALQFRDAAREADEALATIRGLLERVAVPQAVDDVEEI
jgi:two-component system chemotaxis response regulator CheB